MKQFRTRGIVLKRINFGESDRIVTFLTFDQGIVTAMVKGARKQGSKLAGGIELFTESDLTFVRGRGQLANLISSRTIIYFSHIINDYDRVELAYQIIASVAKAANQFDEPKLYDLLIESLKSLDNDSYSITVIECWVKLNLLRILGQQPNLSHDVEGKKLLKDKTYTLLPDDGALKVDSSGEVTTDMIKVWRVMIASTLTDAKRVNGLEVIALSSLPKIRLLFDYQFS